MYCTIDDLREEGITLEQADDNRLLNLCEKVTEYIDDLTQQWFEPRRLTMYFNGKKGQKTLYLPIFLIEAESIKIDGHVVTDVELYNDFYPKSNVTSPKVYRDDGWGIGKRNVAIKGTWGRVAPNLKTPAQIQKVAKMLVIKDIALLTDTESQEEQRRNRIVSETTDGHSYTLAKVPSSISYTGDPEIDLILDEFRKSISIGGA